MLTSPDPLLASAKLSDFDTMRDVSDRMTRLIGTNSYRAPETDERDYNEKADIWSLGCLTYILLCRNRRPFPEGSDRRAGPNYQGLDPVDADFIKHCLAYEAENRPSAAELLHHPFLKADDQLITTFSTILDNSIAQARLLATFSLADGYSAASNAYRMALETMDIYRDKRIEGWENLQGKVDELEHLTDQLFRQLS
jgi:serine/threonine protein kinase